MDRLGVIERKPICAIVVIGLLCSLAVPGCRRHEESSVATTQLDHDASSKAAPWSYEGETGPERWGELNPDWAIAATGKRQSPIDLRTGDVDPAAGLQLVFSYDQSPVEIVNTGHSIEVVQGQGGHVTIDDEVYNLQQYHFHAPSEHTIDGKHAEMEVHMVHANERGELSVVGMLIEAGESSEVLAAIKGRIPTTPGERKRLEDGFVNAEKLLPRDRGYFRYDGSLTTPPCSEGVIWIVMREPIHASQEQIDRIENLYPGTNRPIQDRNDRPVKSAE